MLDRRHFKVSANEPSALITFVVENGQFTLQPVHQFLSKAHIALAGCIAILFVAVNRQAFEAAFSARTSNFRVKIFKVRNHKFVASGGYSAVELNGGAVRGNIGKSA